MPRILLHVCCGPCSLMPVVHLRDEGFEPTAFFFNPNIHPADEWKKRRDAMREVSEKLGVPLLEEGGPENPGLWVRALHGVTREGERCALCYRPTPGQRPDGAQAFHVRGAVQLSGRLRIEGDAQDFAPGEHVLLRADEGLPQQKLSLDAPAALRSRLSLGVRDSRLILTVAP